MKSNLKTLLFYIVSFALIAFAIIFFVRGDPPEPPEFSEIVAHFQEGRVQRLEFTHQNELEVTLHPEGDEETGESFSVRVQDRAFFLSMVRDYLGGVGDNPVRVEVHMPAMTPMPFWVSFLPWLILIGVFVAMWIWASRMAMGRGGGAGGGRANSFGRSRAKIATNDKNRVYFRDVAGADEEKEELTEIVEYLRNPEKFANLGARIPRGVLLVGPPGTGKTLIAKAVAGEAGVPFYSISGSDFVEMYVGVGASRVRDLFETARKHPASIVFIDEIDAVGRHRGAGLGGGHDEREQTLNQLLVEMDGFTVREGIIIMAATNRPDILDPALLRPGRFDRQVTMNYPDIKGRKEVLAVHARNKPFEAEVDFEKVAQMTVGFSPADLMNLLNEAALLAARKGKSLIGMNDIEESSIKIMVGTQKKSIRIKESEKLKTAYHEAGHAMLFYLLPTQDPVRQISIIPCGRALGYTMSVPEEDKYSVYKQELKEKIACLLGGRVAEKIIFDDVSGGASDDIRRATGIARNMVTRYGMSDLGPVLYGSEHSSDEVFLGRDFSSNEKNYSEETASKIDAEIRKIIDDAFSEAERLLTENIDKLHFIANFLIKYEVMDDNQFCAVMSGNPTMEELEEMVAEKKRVSEQENEARRKKDEEERIKREKELEERDAQYRASLEQRYGVPPSGGDPPSDPPNPPTPPSGGSSSSGDNSDRIGGDRSDRLGE